MIFIVLRKNSFLLKYLLVLLLLPAFIVPAFAQTDYLKVSPSDIGTLNVGLKMIPENPSSGEEVKFQIDFINPKNDKIQEHIDYKFTLQRDGQNVFGPTPLIHTSEGRATIPVEIIDDGTYFALIQFEGILFQPIPEEMVSFTVNIGEETNGNEQTPPPDDNGGCLIATATFGSELSPQVQQLREVRDNKVMKTNSGSAFMTGFNEIYYSFSPAIADLERQNPLFKETVRITITPLLTSLSILNYVEINSDFEMLSYGIGLISLNIGMYFGLPALIITKWYKIRR